MPPKLLFRAKARPSGLEFPSCRDCNNGTSAADALIGFFARIEPFGSDDPGDWKLKEAVKYLRSAESGAPGLVREILGDEHVKDSFLRSASGLILPVVETHAGPIAQKLLGVWSLKLAMALFSAHTSKALPLDGGAFGLWFLNAGLAEEVAEGFLKILPVHASLVQGRKSASGQFDYRFNSDGKEIVAALSHFHSNIHFFTIGFADPKIYGFPERDLKHGVFARPGQLLSMMPRRKPLLALANPLRPNLI